MKVEERSNEITAIPELLELLDLTGAHVTIDAMGTQTEIVKQIHHKKADCIVSLKANHPTLHSQVKDWFDTRRANNDELFLEELEKLEEVPDELFIEGLEELEELEGLGEVMLERLELELELEEDDRAPVLTPLILAKASRLIFYHLPLLPAVKVTVNSPPIKKAIAVQHKS